MLAAAAAVGSVRLSQLGFGGKSGFGGSPMDTSGLGGIGAARDAPDFGRVAGGIGLLAALGLGFPMDTSGFGGIGAARDAPVFGRAA